MVKETFRKVGKRASELHERLRDLEPAHPDFELRRRVMDAVQELAARASDRAESKWPLPNREASRKVNALIDTVLRDLRRAPQSVQNDETVKVLLQDLLDLRDRET
jgi:hypothetical protein